MTDRLQPFNVPYSCKTGGYSRFSWLISASSKGKWFLAEVPLDIGAAVRRFGGLVGHFCDRWCRVVPFTDRVRVEPFRAVEAFSVRVSQQLARKGLTP